MGIRSTAKTPRLMCWWLASRTDFGPGERCRGPATRLRWAWSPGLQWAALEHEANDRQTFERAVRIEAADFVLGSLLWKQGTWRTEVGAASSAVPRGATALFDLQLDGAMLLANWASIQRHVQDLDLMITGVKPKEIDADCSSLQEFLWPGTTIRQVVAWHSEGRWTTLQQLANLCERGVIRLEPRMRPAHAEAKTPALAEQRRRQ